MASVMIPVQLPETLFRKLERAAALTHRSIEEIAATSLEAVLPTTSGVSSEMANELAAMRVFSDDALRAAVAPAFAPTEEQRLAQLNGLTGVRDLTAAEQSEQNDLIQNYRRSVLRRAQALAILAQRGHPISMYLASNVEQNGK